MITETIISAPPVLLNISPPQILQESNTLVSSQVLHTQNVLISAPILKTVNLSSLVIENLTQVPPSCGVQAELANIPPQTHIQIQDISQPETLNALNTRQVNKLSIQAQNIFTPTFLHFNKIPTQKSIDLLSIATPCEGDVHVNFLKIIPPRNKSIAPPLIHENQILLSQPRIDTDVIKFLSIQTVLTHTPSQSNSLDSVEPAFSSVTVALPFVEGQVTTATAVPNNILLLEAQSALPPPDVVNVNVTCPTPLFTVSQVQTFANQTTHSVASHTLKRFANIDLTSANNLERIHIPYSQLRSLLNIHGFQLYKIYLNSRAFSNEHNMIFTSEVNLDLVSSFSKVLGINRLPYQDDFSFKLPICEEAPPLTKRKLCTYVSRMYNSLGKLLSFRVHSKSFLQRIWSLPLDWDSDILDDLLISDWKSLLDTYQSISKITFPRCLTLPLLKSDMQLHCFTDASQDIYAACVYLRVVYSDNTVTSRLIASKTRIAPLKNKLTIPRLELSGILLGVTLTRKVLEVLSKNVTISEVHIFLDSLIALTWILTTKFTWNPFVLHRVSQIKELSKSFLFHHVSSSLNVADLPSRASDITQSNLKKFWTEGPPFLVSSVIDYSQFRIKEWTGDLLELRHTQVTLSTTSDISQVNNTLETLFNKCSSFSKIQRTLAYVFRFLSNLRKRHTNSPLELGPLQVCEISSSTTVIVKYIQSQAFPKEFHELKHRKIISDKTIRALNPFLSEKTGLLHVGGRLEFAPISFEQKHPLLLPSNHSVVKLMIKQMHVKLGHAGALTTLSNFRSRYWPISGLRQTKKIIHDCVKCFRFMTPKSTQLMADLYPDRVLSTRPFQKVSVDYGGFFMIRSPHLRKAPLYKAYIAFFICMTTKCVHIELVTGLTADAFILTLKRFIARRSAPEIIWSDNATNFYGARNQLLELNELFKSKNFSQRITNFCSENSIRFKFGVPRNPFQFGLHEVGIKGAKYHLYRLVGNVRFTFEVFYTIICQIEAILNSRPITQLSNDPNDLSVLTAGHFLVGKSLTSPPEPDLSEIPQNRLSLFQHISKIHQTFWKRWSVEYLHMTQSRSKWNIATDPLKIGDVVLIKDEETPPLLWPLAKIIEVLPGKDSLVRTVRVSTPNGEYLRSIKKVARLPFNQ
ncbi:uncharacterized protein [Diabrotica undecimpunctata]|uniref:uncharacterized protein n=1 Tax=Diabrotica undecimpunctata TaxID=50387 RepID=UPI003B633E91